MPDFITPVAKVLVEGSAVLRVLLVIVVWVALFALAFLTYFVYPPLLLILPAPIVGVYWVVRRLTRR